MAEVPSVRQVKSAIEFCRCFLGVIPSDERSEESRDLRSAVSYQPSAFS